MQQIVARSQFHYGSIEIIDRLTTYAVLAQSQFHYGSIEMK